MEVKSAVAMAKAHFNDVFEAENIEPATLEEVWFDRDAKQWNVTFGMRRITTALPTNLIERIQDQHSLRRSLSSATKYKVVVIDDVLGEIVGIKNRELVEAA